MSTSRANNDRGASSSEEGIISRVNFKQLLEEFKEKTQFQVPLSNQRIVDYLFLTRQKIITLEKVTPAKNMMIGELECGKE
jgi:hypothetical protein